MYFYRGIKHDSKLRMQIGQKIMLLKLKLILIDLSKERKYLLEWPKSSLCICQGNIKINDLLHNFPINFEFS